MAIKGTRVKQMKEGGVPSEPHKAGKGGCRGWGGTAAEKGVQGGDFNKAQGLSPPSCLENTARCRGKRWLGVGGPSYTLCPLCSELIEEQHTASMSPFPGPGIQAGL